MLIADNAAPRTVVQVNTLRISAEKLAERLTAEHVCVKPHEWMADCLVLSGTGSLEQLPAFREGLFYVQDPAAKLSILCAGLAESGRERAGLLRRAGEARALPAAPCHGRPWKHRLLRHIPPQNCPDRKRCRRVWD